MSLPKAQLVDPQGNMNLPGMTATGIVTASSLKGVTTGSATGLTGNPDLDVGIVTASSFVGQGDGHAANLTGTPQLNLGVTTSTGFVGDAVGKAAGLTGTPNLNVGLITATSFVGFVTGNIIGDVSGDVTGTVTGDVSGDVEGNITGNVSGLARALGINGINVWTGAGTSNLGVGVCTALELYGDGSNLTGAGSSAYIAQNITATGYAGDTIIDLTYGNLIYFKGESVTTVGFASTSAAEQITFIRNTDALTYDIDMDTAGVDFDAGDNITQTADAVLRNWFDQEFTVEYWIYADSLVSTDGGSSNVLGCSTLGSNSNFTWSFGPNGLGQVRFGFWTGSSETAILPTQTISTGTWYHLAFVHESDGTSKIFIDGVLGKEYKITNGAADGGTFNVGKVQTKNFDGKISNLRITHQALYSNDFIPPREALTTTSQGAIASNVKLLCCQSSTDDTAATVTPNTFSANGTPTPGAETITQSGSLTPSVTWPARVKWKDGVTPTFQERVGGFQVFRFTTGDTGLTYNAWEESKSGAGFNMFAAGSGGGKGMHGNNTAGNVSSPVQVLGGASWRDVSSSQSATAMAIKTDNTLWTWGNPTEGQSGLNSRTKHSSPIQVGTDTTWSNVNRGYNWWYAVKTNGTLWAWGYKTGSVMNDNTTRSSPTQVGTDTNWSIGVGGNNAAALLTKTNGTLWSCGNGEFGVLAQNNHTGYSSPKQVGTDTTWASGENKIGNAYSYSGALKANGTLWMWGLNGNGTLGQNNRSQRSSPVQVGTDTTWTQFSTLPGTGAMGLKTDGTLWVWGGNQQGVLGLNEANPAYRSSPTQLPGTNWSNFGAFGAGNKKAACLKSDGTWWSWGYQMWGEFGINQGNTSLSGAFSSPVQLPGTYVDFASDTYNSFWLKA